MPNPTFTALLSSGRISPKREPLGRPGGGGEEGEIGGDRRGDLGEGRGGGGLGSEATGGVQGPADPAGKRLGICGRLVFGHEFRPLWLARPPDVLLPASCAVSLADGDRKAPYDVAPPGRWRSSGLLDPVSRAGRRFGRRLPWGLGSSCRIKLFFRSFTLVPARDCIRSRGRVLSREVRVAIVDRVRCRAGVCSQRGGSGSGRYRGGLRSGAVAVGSGRGTAGGQREGEAAAVASLYGLEEALRSWTPR